MRYFAFKLDAQAAAGQAALAVQAFEQMQSRARQMSAVVRAAVIRAYLGTDRKDEALLQLERGLEASSQEGAGVVGAVVGFSSEHLSGQEVLDALPRAHGCGTRWPSSSWRPGRRPRRCA
jgi:hypothetical protein